MSDPTLLVTGANGFLGSAILQQAMHAELNVRATSQEPTGANPNVPYLQADITQPQQLPAVVAGVSTVIHAAGLAHIAAPDGRTAELFHRINEIGTANMLKASVEAGVKHFVLISSVSVYGPCTECMCAEDAPCNPVGPYALSKYNAEVQARALAATTGMALSILRLATLYGADDPGNVRRLMQQLDRGQFIWIGDGQNRKSLLHRQDAARACVTVAMNPRNSVATYNVSGPPSTMRTIVTTLASELGRKPLPIRIPGRLALYSAKQLSRLPFSGTARLHATVRKWLANDVYDTSRIEHDHGFFAQTSLESGLREEVTWYRNTHSNRYE